MRLGFLLPFVFVASTTWASFNTVGPNGINSRITELTGANIAIGQAEGRRSSKAGYDAFGMSASNTDPEGVFWQTSSGMDGPQFSTFGATVSEHATTVAGVIIGTDDHPPCGTCSGVAMDAKLYSIGVGDVENDSTFALSLNRILRLSGVTMRAINISTGPPLGFFEQLNGNSQITQYVDWSARRYDVLYAIAWG